MMVVTDGNGCVGMPGGKCQGYDVWAKWWFAAG